MADAASPIAPFPPGGASALRRRQRMEQWRRRSRLIHFMRKALPALIAAILVLLAGWVLMRGVLVRFSDLRGASAALIHMSNARFYGRDGDQKAYILGANIAERDNLDPHLIVLTNPILSLDAGDPHGTTPRFCSCTDTSRCAILAATTCSPTRPSSTPRTARSPDRAGSRDTGLLEPSPPKASRF